MDNEHKEGKSVYSRYDALNQYYTTAYPQLSHELALTRFMDRSWLEPERPMPECIHELHALAEMHVQNLRSLRTEKGYGYYLTHLDLPSAISVDLQENDRLAKEKQDGPRTNSAHLNPTAMNENDKLERTFLVQCTKEQLIDLGHYMTAQGIFFKKCSEAINTEAHAEIFPVSQETADGTVRPQ